MHSALRPCHSFTSVPSNRCCTSSQSSRTLVQSAPRGRVSFFCVIFAKCTKVVNTSALRPRSSRSVSRTSMLRIRYFAPPPLTVDSHARMLVSAFADFLTRSVSLLPEHFSDLVPQSSLVRCSSAESNVPFDTCSVLRISLRSLFDQTAGLTRNLCCFSSRNPKISILILLLIAKPLRSFARLLRHLSDVSSL